MFGLSLIWTTCQFTFNQNVVRVNCIIKKKQLLHLVLVKICTCLTIEAAVPPFRQSMYFIFLSHTQSPWGVGITNNRWPLPTLPLQPPHLQHQILMKIPFFFLFFFILMLHLIMMNEITHIVYVVLKIWHNILTILLEVKKFREKCLTRRRAYETRSLNYSIKCMHHHSIFNISYKKKRQRLALSSSPFASIETSNIDHLKRQNYQTLLPNLSPSLLARGSSHTKSATITKVCGLTRVNLGWPESTWIDQSQLEFTTLDSNHYVRSTASSNSGPPLSSITLIFKTSSPSHLPCIQAHARKCYGYVFENR